MARKTRTPVLPGQSRSAACSATCSRLSGHKGDHRATLLRSESRSTVAAPVTLTVVSGKRTYLVTLGDAGTATYTEVLATRAYKRNGEAVEVHSADRYTVPAEETPKPRKPRKQARCRISRAGTRCSRAYGHKAKGLRHNFSGSVRVVGEAKSTRQVAAPSKTVKRERFVESGRPSSRLA
jgi:hypothetical protein